MGDDLLILAFVVIVIGGIGSIRGAFVAALLVGVVDTIGRAFLRPLFALVMSGYAADNAGPATRLDADLHPDGDGAVLPAAGPVSPRAIAMKSSRNRLAVTLAVLRRRWRCVPPVVGRLRPAVLSRSLHPRHDLRHRRGQPRSHPRLWRHGELRPCRLSRHRRLCGRHPRLLRHHQRLRAVRHRDRRLGADRACASAPFRCAPAASISS